jgi:GNAT superfamily N-acetyltransferase
MEVRIRELNRELIADYLGFFDDIYNNDPWLKFKDNPWWGGCYCTFYDDPRTEGEINASKDKRSENRARRKETIEQGRASGLLAYSGEVVGWCNVAPRGSYVNPRFIRQAMDKPDEKVGSITCFVVSHKWRGLGVSAKLLEGACKMIKAWGLPLAEGYPTNPEIRQANPYSVPTENLSYHGSLNTFLRSGFHVHRKLEGLLVVRKSL